MNCDKITSCSDILKNPIISFKDSEGKACKSEFRLDNKKRLEYSRIDFENCVYKGDKIKSKCDFGMVLGKSIYFIEVKGEDYTSGIGQLLSTINDTKDCFESFNVYARLVQKKSPSIQSLKDNAKYKKLVKLTKKRNGNFKRSTILLKEKI